MAWRRPGDTPLCEPVMVNLLTHICVTPQWGISNYIHTKLCYVITRPCHNFNGGSQVARFMGPTWGPPGSCQPQMDPMLAPWTLLWGISLTAVLMNNYIPQKNYMWSLIYTPISVIIRCIGEQAVKWVNYKTLEWGKTWARLRSWTPRQNDHLSIDKLFNFSFVRWIVYWFKLHCNSFPLFQYTLKPALV